MLSLLEDDWGSFAQEMNQLKQWTYYPELIESLKNLKREALFQSPVHGIGHIERTILHGAMAAMDGCLSLRDTQLLLLACCYHDTGRLTDWMDDAHGRRSAFKLQELTGLAGEELAMVMAAVEAHSVRDDRMEEILADYEYSDRERGRRLALMLKDSDGLDRVRISDLDTSFLRCPAAAGHAALAEALFERYRKAEKAAGLLVEDRLAYYDKSLLAQVRDFLQAGLAKRTAPMQLVNQCLRDLLNTQPTEALDSGPCSPAKQNRPCSGYQGVLAFLMNWCRVTGEEEEPLLAAFKDGFVKQYRSLLCRDLRGCGFREADSPYLCAPFLLDIILYTYRFLQERAGKA